MPRCDYCDAYYYSVKDRTLHHAAAKGYLDVLKFLILEEGWSLDDYICSDGDFQETPLYLACQSCSSLLSKSHS